MKRQIDVEPAKDLVRLYMKHLDALNNLRITEYRLKQNIKEIQEQMTAYCDEFTRYTLNVDDYQVAISLTAQNIASITLIPPSFVGTEFDTVPYSEEYLGSQK